MRERALKSAMPGFAANAGAMLVALLCVLLAHPVAAQPNIDGGRSDLPGMKQDIFDQVNRAKKQGHQQRGKGPPECPKSDKMTPFMSMSFVGTELFVRINSSEGKCEKFISVGGANYSVLANASKTCGPAGEWKKRIAEEMSAVFFQGGLEWVKSENETIEVVTEDGVYQAEVSEAKYAEMEACWKMSCDCEQAKNPITRCVLIALFVIAAGGLSVDSFKLAWETIRGKKPPKHVQCKKGHKMSESNYASNHLCDICRKSGTQYQCNEKCNYDLCKDCYKKKKKEIKAKYKEWLEKHPDDPDNKKKDKEDKEEEDKADDDEKKEDSQSEAGDKKDAKSDAEKSEPESTGEKTGSEARGEEAEDEKADEKVEAKEAEEEKGDEAK